MVGGRNIPARMEHRRGLSLNGISKETDENLDLFSRNRRSLSLASSDESDGTSHSSSLSTSISSFSLVYFDSVDQNALLNSQISRLPHVPLLLITPQYRLSQGLDNCSFLQFNSVVIDDVLELIRCYESKADPLCGCFFFYCWVISYEFIICSCCSSVFEPWNRLSGCFLGLFCV